MNKTCFVVMPFGKEGTEEHETFKSLFEQVYESVAREAGYSAVERGDSQLRSGQVLQQVIKQIAISDLVIADLTTANPNVYYELGVRHSLHARGTILCFDSQASADLTERELNANLPFNVQSYRTISYTAELKGISIFKTTLRKAIDSRQSDAGKDSPVHDAIPGLPLVVSASEDQLTKQYQETIHELESQIGRYQAAYGSLDSSPAATHSDPNLIIDRALTEAEAGNTPTSVLQEAEAAANVGDVVAFLKTVKRLQVMSFMPPTARDFIQIYAYSEALGLGEVGLAILRLGRKRHSQNTELESIEINEATKSADREGRLEAKISILDEINSDSSRSVVLSRISRSRFNLRLNAVLDAFYKSEEPEDALEITSALLALDFADTTALRSHGRAIEQLEGFDSSLLWHRASVCLDTENSDSNAVWLGNHLHNEGYRAHAAEAFALACRLDPDDPKNFANLADEVALFLLDRDRRATASRGLPPEVATFDFVREALRKSIGTNSVLSQTRSAREFQERAASNIDTDLESIVGELLNSPEEGSRSARLSFADSAYAVLSTDLTTNLRPIEGLTELTALDAMPADLIAAMPRDLQLDLGIVDD